MRTKSNSHGLKSKTGCLWESNMMWFVVSKRYNKLKLIVKNVV